MKKPVYKKWWFWVIVLLVIAGAGAGTAGKKDKKASIDNSGATETANSSGSTSDNAESTLQTTEQQKVKVGGNFTYDNMKVTINSADLDFHVKDDTFNMHTPKEGYKLISVAVTVENLGDSDEYVGTTDFKCFADNTECDDDYISSESEFINSNLSPGRNVSFKLFYFVPQNASSIELEYARSFSFDDNKVIIQLQ